ncbi:U-box domain-containing protein 19 [Linum perenne]
MILSRLESGGVLDRGGMKRVMDYIRVKRWSDCYNELARIYELLRDVCCSIPSTKKAICLLDSAMSSSTASTAITSDCLNSELLSTKLVPNVALNQLIHHYCFENCISIADSSRKSRDITRSASAGSLAAELATKSAASFLAGELFSGDDEERNKATYEIRLLRKTSIFKRSCLVEAGVLSSLLQLLASEDGPSQENAIAGPLNLSKHSRRRASIVDNGGLKIIVQVLKSGLALEAKQHSAITLFYLASIQDYRKLPK